MRSSSDGSWEDQAVDMWTTLRTLRVAHIPTALLLLHLLIQDLRPGNYQPKGGGRSGQIPI